MTTSRLPLAASQQAAVDAALLILERMGLSPDDLTAAPRHRPAVPTFADYVPVVSATVTAGTRKAYGSYWNRVTEQWGARRLDEPTPSEIKQLVAYVRANAVPRRNARGGRSAAENLIAALRCLYKHAEDDGFIDERDNPARKVAKPRRLPSTRRAVADTRLAEINQVAATTGDDPELDTLILRLHTETACRRGGALALRPADLDREQCLILLREKGETVRWQPVSPTLMAALVRHAEERHAPPDGRLLRYADGHPVTYRRYDGLWVRIGRHLPWARTQQISTHWLRHTTLTWVERNFGFADRPRLRRAHRRRRRHRQRHLDVRARHARRGRHRPGRADRRTPPPRRTGRSAAWQRWLTSPRHTPTSAPVPRPTSPVLVRRSPVRSSPGTGPERSGTRPGPCGPGRCWSSPSPPPPKCGPAGSASRSRPASALVPPLPGIWSSLHLDTAVTLPVGVECYAAYALRAWLVRRARGQRPDPPVRHVVSDLLLRARHGRAGRVSPDGPEPTSHGHPGASPPWCPASRSWSWAMGTALAHMLREDAAAASHVAAVPGPAARVPLAWSPAAQPGDQPDQDPPDRTTRQPRSPGRTRMRPRHDGHAAAEPVASVPHTAEPGIEHARGIARELAGAGQRVSRRALRSQGVRGSNAALNALALTLSGELANDTAGPAVRRQRLGAVPPGEREAAG